MVAAVVALLCGLVLVGSLDLVDSVALFVDDNDVEGWNCWSEVEVLVVVVVDEEFVGGITKP